MIGACFAVLASGAVARELGKFGVQNVGGSGATEVLAQQAAVSAACGRTNNPRVGVGDCAANDDTPSGDRTSASSDDGGWVAAVAHSTSAAMPKGGCDEVSWDLAFEIIWSDDLERDNTVSCRVTIG